ncbi:MAG TPA: TrkA family potassium uptake protein [Anaerolineales bacterium]|nr:TrkA family potassium uptake protein [Anaerolineales bacterium]
MKMIIIGCGRVGAELATRLFQNGHSVVVVDNSEAAFQNLPTGFRGRTVHGEALSKDVLQRTGIEEADGVALVTNNDTLNAVVGHLARKYYGVPVVVVRNYDSRWRSVHETFGIQTVSSSSWGAQRIEELLYQQQTRTVFSAGNGEVELYEFAVPKEWDGKSLNKLMPEAECVLAALTRAGKAILPDCDILLEAGDIVLISATLTGSETIRQRLSQGPVLEEG